jgi:hypothetical protein
MKQDHRLVVFFHAHVASNPDFRHHEVVAIAGAIIEGSLGELAPRKLADYTLAFAISSLHR